MTGTEGDVQERPMGASSRAVGTVLQPPEQKRARVIDTEFDLRGGIDRISELLNYRGHRAGKSRTNPSFLLREEGFVGGVWAWGGGGWRLRSALSTGF